ncbi:MAG: hypothetical protein J6Y78_10845 [Paludibacteraceae bacterium]|nr:hypothetical protein [Paludibacteraceae bacterium]
MSEVHLRNRLASARAMARNAPVKSVTGFTVESKKAMDYPSNNVIVFVNGKVAFGEWLVGDE